MAGHYTGRHGGIDEIDPVGIALTGVLVAEGVPLLHACMASHLACKNLEALEFDVPALLAAARTVAHERMTR